MMKYVKSGSSVFMLILHHVVLWSTVCHVSTFTFQLASSVEDPNSIACDFGSCVDAYHLTSGSTEVNDYLSSVTPTESLAYRNIEFTHQPKRCSTFRGLIACIQKHSRDCIGNLHYHSAYRGAKRLLKKLNCSREGPIQKLTGPSTVSHAIEQYENNEQEIVKGRERSISNSAASDDIHVYFPSRDEGPAYQSLCSFTSRSTYRQCIAFGEVPHLKTFYDEFQTCQRNYSIILVDNDYLMVAMNNDTDIGGVMVTVVVKKQDDCLVDNEVIYQAHSGQLPSTFAQISAKNASQKVVESLHTMTVIRTIQPGVHVEIDLKHISTTVSVRAIGKSLYSVSIAMPDYIVLKSHRAGGSTLQLCLYLCPRSQRINIYEDQPIVWIPPAHTARPSINDAIILCTSKRLQSGAIYFDACVYDVIVTGDINATFAAELAAVDADRFSRLLGFSPVSNDANGPIVISNLLLLTKLLMILLLLAV